MKTIKVVAAIIKQGDKIFATQRGYGEFKDGWEFPGGKVEPGETDEAALVREIKEELDADINVLEFFAPVEYDYPDFHLSMNCYVCELAGTGDEAGAEIDAEGEVGADFGTGGIVLKEHESAKWLTKEQLDSVDWLPADIDVVERLKSCLTVF